MDLKTINIFLQIADARSMKSVAGSLGYTPSGLSHMMNTLEEDLDVKLLDRNARGVSLTRAGEALLPLFRDLVAGEQAIRNEIRLNHTQSLHIGACSSIAQTFLPEILLDLMKKYPDIRFIPSVVETKEGCSLLRDGSLSILLAGYEKDAALTFFPLMTEQYYAVLPEEEGDTAVPFSRFDGLPFLSPENARYPEISEAFRAEGIRPKMIRAEVDDPTLLSMTAAGLGFTILPQSALPRNVPGIRFLPMVPPLFREIGISVRTADRLSRIEKDVIEMAQKHFR